MVKLPADGSIPSNRRHQTSGYEQTNPSSQCAAEQQAEPERITRLAGARSFRRGRALNCVSVMRVLFDHGSLLICSYVIGTARDGR